MVPHAGGFVEWRGPRALRAPPDGRRKRTIHARGVGREGIVSDTDVRAACGAERDRLWARWAEVDRGPDTCAARRSHPTAVVVLEPVDGGPR